MYVVVTGPPASGKSTLARVLADALGRPLLAKDEIKERLIRETGPRSVEESRELGREAVRLLLAAAAGVEKAVLDSVWVDRTAAPRELASLGEVVEVFCRCDHDLMRDRYGRRAPTKGAGHFDAERPEEELWPPQALEPLAGGWPVLEVDTTGRVDLDDLVGRIRSVEASRPRPPG
jgi:predicted kinase